VTQKEWKSPLESFVGSFYLEFQKEALLIPQYARALREVAVGKFIVGV